MKYQIVNAEGLRQIHDILAKNHKLGGDHFDKEMIQAWADGVEFQLAEGNSPQIELKETDSVSGHTECFEIDAEGVEWAGEDDDE